MLFRCTYSYITCACIIEDKLECVASNNESREGVIYGGEAKSSNNRPYVTMIEEKTSSSHVIIADIPSPLFSFPSLPSHHSSSVLSLPSFNAPLSQPPQLTLLSPSTPSSHSPLLASISDLHGENKRMFVQNTASDRLSGDATNILSTSNEHSLSKISLVAKQSEEKEDKENFTKDGHAVKKLQTSKPKQKSVTLAGIYRILVISFESTL